MKLTHESTLTISELNLDLNLKNQWGTSMKSTLELERELERTLKELRFKFGNYEGLRVWLVKIGFI